MDEVTALELVHEYYLSATRKEQAEHARGQMYWCACCYFKTGMSILYPRGSDPYDKLPTLFETRDIDPRKFNEPPHRPLTRPRLEAEEEFIVLRAKNRPVITLSSKPEPWKYRDGKTRDECVLVVPAYSFHELDSAEWKLRIRALAYRELFYLPGDQTLGLSESFLRFDRAHVVPCRWLRGKGVCLHPDALELLTDWFQFYLTGELDEYLSQHRDELLAAVKETLGGLSAF
jgi:hypothetical protein